MFYLWTISVLIISATFILNQLGFVNQNNLFHKIGINLNAINSAILLAITTFCVVLQVQMFVILPKKLSCLVYTHSSSSSNIIYKSFTLV